MVELISISNKRNQEVGVFNLDTKTYHTTRDSNKGQVFLHPKWLGCIAIDRYILKQLAQMQCETISITIVNYEPKTFTAIIDFNTFLQNSEEICFDKHLEGLGFKTFYSEQRRININQFERVNTNGHQTQQILP